MTRRLRVMASRNAYWSLGVKIGYWPCLAGPFISFTAANVRLDVWHGKPSYFKSERP